MISYLAELELDPDEESFSLSQPNRDLNRDLEIQFQDALNWHPSLVGGLLQVDPQ